MSATDGPAGPLTRTTAWARGLGTPLRDYLRTETGGAAVLLGAALAALVWANVDAASYASVWGTELTLRLGDWTLAATLRHWVNDGLMAIFFLVVGLEARRELDLGELRERRRLRTAPRRAAARVAPRDRTRAAPRGRRRGRRTSSVRC